MGSGNVVCYKQNVELVVRLGGRQAGKVVSHRREIKEKCLLQQQVGAL